jgi:hypothetical protein
MGAARELPHAGHPATSARVEVKRAPAGVV